MSQMILDGIFIGAVFALAAYGLALVWGVMNVKNLAQGDFVIMGGYLAFSLFNMGVGPIAALPIVAVVMFGFGWICYLLIIKRVIDNDMFVSLLATFGLSLFLQQVMNLIYGPEVQTIDSKFPIATMFDSFVTVPMAKVVSLLLAAGFCCNHSYLYEKRAEPVRPYVRPRRMHAPPVCSVSIPTAFMHLHFH